MKSWGKLVVCAVLLSMCVGCFRIETLIRLNEDGSGKLFLRGLLSTSVQAKQQLGDKSEELAKKLGDGVTFVRAKDVESKGWRGIQAEYDFTDINKLRIGADVFEPQKSQDTAPNSETNSPELDLAFLSGKKEGPWRFRYTPGAVNELVAYHQRPKVDTDEDDPFAEAGVVLTKAPTADVGVALAASFLRPMLTGAHASLTVQVDGDIVETNAPKQPKPNSVQLFHLDLAKFAASKKFDRAVVQSWGVDRLVREKVAGITALESDQEVTVRFQ